MGSFLYLFNIEVAWLFTFCSYVETGGIVTKTVTRALTLRDMDSLIILIWE